jgi:hypothetical protein
MGTYGEGTTNGSLAALHDGVQSVEHKLGAITTVSVDRIWKL